MQLLLFVTGELKSMKESRGQGNKPKKGLLC
jgi:hypothetical protein